MPGGMSGLSLSEMGISVKKAGKAVQKAGTGVVQQAAQQITGQAPVQNPGGVSKPEPVFETDDSGNPLGFFKAAAKQVAGSTNQQQQQPNKPAPTFATDDLGNPVDLFGGAVQQMKGQGNQLKSQSSASQPAQQGTFVMPKQPSSQPPSEFSPKQAGGFDAALLKEQNIFDNTPLHQQTSQSSNTPLEQEFAKQKAEDEQKIAQLRNQLHQMYYEEFAKKAEGKDQKKEESVQEKLEREKQEEEQKKMKELEEKKKKEDVPLSVKGRQGAHEGLKMQG